MHVFNKEVGMPTAYVKAPITGTITGRDNYCGFPCDGNPCTGDHGAHGKCKSGSSPVDVAGSGPDIYPR